MTKRIGTRQFKKKPEDTNDLDGITRRLNEWIAAQTTAVRIINIETLPLAFGVAVQVWYEVEDQD